MKIIFHVGPHKTATTSIQNLLSINRNILANFGFHVPFSTLDQNGFHELPWSIKKWDTRLISSHGETRTGIEILNEVIEAASSRGLHTIIISSEDLSLLKLKEWISLIQNLQNREIEVIISKTKREKKEWKDSAYNQLLTFGLRHSMRKVSIFLSIHRLVFKTKFKFLEFWFNNVKYIEINYSKNNFLANWWLNMKLPDNINQVAGLNIRTNISFGKEVRSLILAINKEHGIKLNRLRLFQWPEAHTRESLLRLHQDQSQVIK